jgi:hypothetical protein
MVGTHRHVQKAAPRSRIGSLPRTRIGERVRRLLAGLGAFWVAGCGVAVPSDPTVVPVYRWPAEYARVACARIAGCCDAQERMRYFYENDAQCRAMQADLRSGVVNLVAQGRIAFPRRGRPGSPSSLRGA